VAYCRGMGAARLSVHVEGPVARVLLARPEARNAFDGATVDALAEAFRDLSVREDVRVVVLGGEGPVFCAGADLAWMKTVAGLSTEQNLAEARTLAALFAAIDRSPKPVVARVQGAALGGGSGLVAVADVVVAASDAVFGFTEVRLGLVPAVISPFVIAKIGVSAARELFLTGERFRAERARAIGLVQHVVATEDLDAVVADRVQQLLQGAPGALAAAKALVRELAGGPDDAFAERTAAVIAERRASAEGREGLAAFLEKRKPRWTE
jgi:methylglutaconyl-CoA hydratase